MYICTSHIFPLILVFHLLRWRRVVRRRRRLTTVRKPHQNDAQLSSTSITHTHASFKSVQHPHTLQKVQYTLRISGRSLPVSRNFRPGAASLGIFRKKNLESKRVRKKQLTYIYTNHIYLYSLERERKRVWHDRRKRSHRGVGAFVFQLSAVQSGMSIGIPH